jgi:hypothetical protein
MGEQDDMPPFAELLMALYQRRERLIGARCTDADVAAGIAALGSSLSPSQLWQLRKGARPDPRRSTMRAIARYFEIPAGYFVDKRMYDDVMRKWEKEELAHGEGGSGDIPEPRGRAHVMLRQLAEMDSETQDLVERLVDFVVMRSDPSDKNDAGDF